MVILCDSLLEVFTDHINNIHSSIKFTWEEESDNTITMLDAKITKSLEGTLSFSVYRKVTLVSIVSFDSTNISYDITSVSLYRPLMISLL